MSNTSFRHGRKQDVKNNQPNKTLMNQYTDFQLIGIAQDLEPILAPLGVHVAIGGSCVYRGYSSKDMDVMLYPHTKKPIDRPAILAVLLGLGWESYRSAAKDFTQVPDVHVAVREGVRVDFFFLSR